MHHRITVPLSELHLDLDNPREKHQSEEEAIEWLCAEQKVENLAQDISQIGLNPLDLVGVIKHESDGWIAVEGNRRACAIKLLADPDLAPSKIRKKFEKFNKNWVDPFDKVECIAFDTRAEADVWLDRLHEGERQGTGRVQWNSLQKSERYAKNERTLLILNYAVKQGWIDDADIKGKLTTAQRYLSNPKLIKTIGIAPDKEELKHIKKLDVFNGILKIFIDDLMHSSVKGSVSSRSNKIEIEQYADELLERYQKAHVSNPDDQKIYTPETVKSSKDTKTSQTPFNSKKAENQSAPSLPRKTKIKLHYCEELNECLEKLDNLKLSTLYLSLFKVNINNSNLVPLVTVAIWCFVESLAVELGKQDTTFRKFYGSYIKNYDTEEKRKSVDPQLKTLNELGNLTKHSGTCANFNSDTLVSIMDTLNPFLVHVINSKFPDR